MSTDERTINLMSDEKTLTIAKISESINKLSRKIDGIEKYLELIYKERELLDELLASNSMIKEFILSSRQHQENLTRDVKLEVQEVQSKVEDKVDEIGQQLEKKKIIKIPDKGIFKRILWWLR